MTFITFNKSNWSGEEATINIRDNKFSFNGYDFELRNFNTVKGDDPKYDFHTVDFYYDGELFGTAHRFECDDEWEYNCGDFYRTHKHPAILCAIVLGTIFNGLPVQAHTHQVTNQYGTTFLRTFYYLFGDLTPLNIIIAAAEELARREKAA
jgi:hypothetical protein